MGFLDSVVGRSFRDEEAGRVVVFEGDRRNRGYILKSEAEELKIRSFLKMFYLAHFSILFFGGLVAYDWSTFFIHLQSLGRPEEHLLRTTGIFLGIYSVVLLLPYLLFWKSYKKARSSFVSVQDEVLVSRKAAKQQPWYIFVLITLALLLLMGVVVRLIGQAK
jgi:hypothetical protein